MNTKEEYKKKIINSLSKAQLKNVDEDGERVIEEEADKLTDYFLQSQLELLEEIKKEFGEIYDPGIFENKLNSRILSIKQQLK